MLCAQVSRHYARQFWAPCNHINALATPCVCVCVCLSLLASYDRLVILAPTQISFIIWSSSVGLQYIIDICSVSKVVYTPGQQLIRDI